MNQAEAEAAHKDKQQEADQEKVEQSARSLLRKDFLRALEALRQEDKDLGGGATSLRLHSGFQTECEGGVLAFDRDFLHLCVEGLRTPTGAVIPQAKLRITDVDSVVFKTKKQQ